MDPKRIIGSLRLPQASGKSYPRQLPGELQAWYCYPLDCGHSIVVALKQCYTPGGDPRQFLVPAPVKAVLRAGYEQRDGYILVDLPYDNEIGLTTQPGDEEY